MDHSPFGTIPLLLALHVAEFCQNRCAPWSTSLYRTDRDLELTVVHEELSTAHPLIEHEKHLCLGDHQTEMKTASEQEQATS